jgi:hypothetical protein
MQRFAPFGKLPHVTVERNGRAAFRQNDATRNRADIEPFGREFKKIIYHLSFIIYPSV